MSFNLRNAGDFSKWLSDRMERAGKSAVRQTIARITQEYNVQPKRLRDNNTVTKGDKKVIITVRNQARRGGGVDNPSNYFITLFHAGGDKVPANYTVMTSSHPDLNSTKADMRGFVWGIGLRKTATNGNERLSRLKDIARSQEADFHTAGRMQAKEKGRTYSKSNHSYGQYHFHMSKKGKIRMNYVKGYLLTNLAVQYGKGKIWNIDRSSLKDKSSALMYFEINKHKGIFLKFRDGKKFKYRELYAMSVAQLEMNMENKDRFQIDLAYYILDEVVKSKSIPYAIKKGFKIFADKPIDKASAQKDARMTFDIITDD